MLKLNRPYKPQNNQPASDQGASNLAPKSKLKPACSFDSWIDDLVEFQEIVLPKSDVRNVTIADALFKVEATATATFDADAVSCTDFSSVSRVS